MSSINHVAIIMDGNDRWANERNLSTSDGHKAGAENAFKIIEAAIEYKIKNLSLFMFSSENLNRPKSEVANFLNLLVHYADNELEKIIKNEIRVKFIGQLDILGPEIIGKLKKAEELSKDFNKINLNMMLCYGSRKEIVEACKKIALESYKQLEITEELFEKNLYLPNMPDVDLLIRAGNQMRISNFLLWQSAYAELYFSKKLWPDFSKEDLKEAIIDFSNRKRTFGLRNVEKVK